MLASFSTSTFSLALDPIAESPSRPYPGSPALRSHLLSDASHLPPVFKRESQPYSRCQSGQFAQPCPRSACFWIAPSCPSLSVQHRTYPVFLCSASRHVIYYTSHRRQEHAKTLSRLRIRLLKRPVVCDGSIDITSRQRAQEHRRTLSRASSLASWLLSLLSPSSSSVPSLPAQSSSSGAPSNLPPTFRGRSLLRTSL